MKISAVILAKNEENNIMECIESLSWCDEIIVTDDGSKDRTIQIVKNLNNEKIRVYIHPLTNDFSSQRNFALNKAKNDWVFFVDADERVTNRLMTEITHLTKAHDRGRQLNGYFIKRIDFMWGKELKYGDTGNTKLLRLGKKSSGEWIGKVHEQWKVNGRVEQLKNPLYHYPHESLAEFLKKINFYTDIRSKELYEKKVKAYWWDIILYPRIKFFTNYFLKRGFLDGIPGLAHALIMSLHSFLVRAKLWTLWHR